MNQLNLLSHQRLSWRWSMLILLLSASMLLMARLDGLSLSVDEFVNVVLERSTWPEMLIQLRHGVDLHPPATHVFMKAWIGLVGESEWTVRFPWVAAGILSVALTFRLAAKLFGARIGVLASLLLLSAPTYLLYMRFEKYYALTITLSLVMLLASVALWQRQDRWRVCNYSLALTALLYTDYLAPFFLTLALNLVLLLFGREQRRLAAFLLAQVAAALLYLPWLAIMMAQASILHGGVKADLGNNLFGMLIALAYWPFSVGIGETIFPWHLAAILGSLALFVMLLAGIRVCLRNPQRPDAGRAGIALVLTLLLSLLGSVWLTNRVFDSVSFIAFPNHTLFLAPLFMVLLAVGAASLPRNMSILLLVLLLLARTVGISNYFLVTDFHNPIYAVPTREIVADLLIAGRANDVVLTTSDIGVNYYYQRLAANQPQSALIAIPIENFEQAIDQLVAQKPARVWLFEFGRDRTAAGSTEAKMAEWLRTNGYSLMHEQGYAEQDYVYRQIKEALFNRPAYQYKLTVQQYELQEK